MAYRYAATKQSNQLRPFIAALEGIIDEMNPIDKAKIHGHEEYRALERIISEIGNYCEKELAALNEEYDRIKDSDSVLADSAVSDISVVEMLGKISEELIIIGLYKKVELTTKKILSIYFPKRNVEKLYEKSELEKILRKCRVKLEDISSYSCVDELRLLCNAIKHQGLVTGSLAKYPQWKKGENITQLLEAYERLKPGVIQYLLNLDSKLKAASNK
ncbi:hypothetical protein [Teredinibacter turnerae]|uniref:hypothetical protein n=1 Tax=Teredinibacter turnerae TaxID=2426 RepID=UPI0030D3486E